ncbi:coiled-coil domain-containing protein 152-like [Cheilinus undulatus]|uniref:coiled-coil domain-containing protein 152-like n=1 Tax=Cheilinus undulatus TaxID=241271 RepID=UPI001BD68AAE|nr:coiled-coil domain-containing protein 152-like [Cheilinus undulatus]
MAKENRVNIEKVLEVFNELEQKVTEVHNKNTALEVTLEDANRHLKFHKTKEKSLIEERDSLLATVNCLQQTLQEQMNLRVENDSLKSGMMELKQQNERTAQAGEAEVQRLVGEMRAEVEKHQRELEAVRQLCKSELEDAQREAFNQMETKDAEVKNLLEKKELELEEMRKKLKEQEREKQSELLKLQMEFGAKLARVQSTAQLSQQQQQQQHGSNLLPQSVFKRKLQFFQEEKNREIEALRQRIKELEENQRAGGHSVNSLKRRKVQFV